MMLDVGEQTTGTDMHEQEKRNDLSRQLDRLVAAHRAVDEAMQPAFRAMQDALRVLGVECAKAIENAYRKRTTRG